MKLSPADHYKKVPKEPRDNLEFRKKIRIKCRESSAFRKKIIELCREDCIFYINTFVHQHNPKGDNIYEQEGPFVTWDFQDAAILGGERVGMVDALGSRIWGILECIEDQRDLVIEKSREMGASWLCLIVMDWMCRFHKNMKFLLLSRDEASVWRPGDSDSLIWKLQYISERLPKWMPGDCVRHRMSLYYKDNSSAITGQAQTKRAGVGGRATAIFCDEFAQMTNAREIIGKTASTSDCRIINSTHLGTGTKFYEMTIDPLVRKLRIHWTLHPKKRRGLYKYDDVNDCIELLDSWEGYVPYGLTKVKFPEEYEFVRTTKPDGPYKGLRSPWYDFHAPREGSPVQVAQNQDMYPAGSVSQYFDPAMINELIRQWCRPPSFVGDVAHDRDTGEPSSLYSTPSGPLSLWTQLDANGRPPKRPYFIGCDVSEGVGTTNSCGSIFNEIGEKVGEYVTPSMTPYEFAAAICALGKIFCDESGNPAKVVWEVPGSGVKMGKRLLELGYPNYYRRSDALKNLMQRSTETVGWVNNQKNFPIVMADYASALYRKVIYNPSRLALEECQNFYYDGGKIKHSKAGIDGGDPSGAGDNHGDRCIADALAVMLLGKTLSSRRNTATKKEPAMHSIEWRRQYSRRNTREKLLSWE